PDDRQPFPLSQWVSPAHVSQRHDGRPPGGDRCRNHAPPRNQHGRNRSDRPICVGTDGMERRGAHLSGRCLGHRLRKPDPRFPTTPSHPVDDQRRRFCHIGVRKRRKNGRKKGLTTPDKSGTDCVQPRTRKGCFPSARLSVPKRPMEKPDTSAVAEVSLNRYLLFPVTIHSDRVCGETTDVSSECAPT